MKEKKIYLSYHWCRERWFILPTVSLHNYWNQFDITFWFMGLYFEIAFMKKLR